MKTLERTEINYGTVGSKSGRAGLLMRYYAGNDSHGENNEKREGVGNKHNSKHNIPVENCLKKYITINKQDLKKYLPDGCKFYKKKNEVEFPIKAAKFFPKENSNGNFKESPIKVGFIYMITNLKNKKTYIGQTVKGYKERFQSHIYESSKLLYPIHYAIQKYGKDNFMVEPLIKIENGNKYLLSALESYYINFYRSTDKKKGYNVSEGGIHGYRWTKQQNDIYNELLKRPIPSYTKNTYNVLLTLIRKGKAIQSKQMVNGVSWFFLDIKEHYEAFKIISQVSLTKQEKKIYEYIKKHFHK